MRRHLNWWIRRGDGTRVLEIPEWFEITFDPKAASYREMRVTFTYKGINEPMLPMSARDFVYLGECMGRAGKQVLRWKQESR
jgi:hypothetical protein